MEENKVTEEMLADQVFYNEILYLPLKDLGISGKVSVEKIIEKSKDRINELKTEKEKQTLTKQVEYLEVMISHNSELKDVKISNMSWQDSNNDSKEDHPYDGMQAAVFTKGNEVNVVFRGTPDKSWIDNAEMEIGASDYSKCYVDKNGNTYNYLSPMQIEAMEYIDKLLREHSDEWADKLLTVGGHSKGDSLAVLAMLINSDEFDICIGINGPSVAPEALKEIIENLGEGGYYQARGKILKLIEYNDYVSPFGDLSLFKAENIKYYKGYTDPKDLMAAHYIGFAYDVKEGKFAEFVDGPGPIWNFVRAAYLEIEKLPPHMRKPVFYAVMGVLQFGVNKKPAIGKDTNLYNYLVKKAPIIIVDLEDILNTTLMDKEGMELIEYLNEIGIEHQFLTSRVYLSNNNNPLRVEVIGRTNSLENTINRLIINFLAGIDEIPNYFVEKGYKTGKVAISYSSIDELIVKIDDYIQNLETKHIQAAKDIKTWLKGVSGVWRGIGKLNTAIDNYKDIKTGLETYKDLLNHYKTFCELIENRFIENLKSIEA